MRLLLDTHVFLELLGAGNGKMPSAMLTGVQAAGVDAHVSVGTFWEIAIKSQIGKLRLQFDIAHLEDIAAELDLTVLSIGPRHVVEVVTPPPETRDPFDRLLLSQCAVDGLDLVTLDRALAAHPLAAKF